MPPLADALLVPEEAGQEVGLPVLEPDGVLDLAVGDDRDAGDPFSGDRRDRDLDLQGHFPLEVDLGASS